MTSQLRASDSREVGLEASERANEPFKSKRNLFKT